MKDRSIETAEQEDSPCHPWVYKSNAAMSMARHYPRSYTTEKPVCDITLRRWRRMALPSHTTAFATSEVQFLQWCCWIRWLLQENVYLQQLVSTMCHRPAWDSSAMVCTSPNCKESVDYT